MNTEEWIQTAKAEAKKIVRKNMTKLGLLASVQGYREVWARDSMIAFLGSAIDGEDTMLDAFGTTLVSLAAYQNTFGQIPNYVELDTKETSYYASDANQWYVIGAAYYHELTHACPDALYTAVEKALYWCESQELDRTDLIISGECADWADLLANHGKVLFPNVLYARALRAGASLLRERRPQQAQHWEEHARAVCKAIQDTFRVREESEVFQDASHWQAQRDAATRLRRCPYLLPWVDLFSYGERFDTTANLLAVLVGVATPEQAAQILGYIRSVGLDRPYPVQVLYPPIRPGDSDWRDYYKVYSLNLPHQYHNGGIWPWVGGLYVAALKKAGMDVYAKETLSLLAQANYGGKAPWEFNEWLFGTTGAPMGAQYQAWSAGMFLFAEHAVRTGRIPGLEDPQ